MGKARIVALKRADNTCATKAVPTVEALSIYTEFSNVCARHVHQVRNFSVQVTAQPGWVAVNGQAAFKGCALVKSDLFMTVCWTSDKYRLIQPVSKRVVTLRFM